MADNTNQQHFPCEECGADLTFKPGTDTLVCGYCGHTNLIRQSTGQIREYNFEQALRAIEQGKLRPLDNTQVIKCPNCSAIFELKPNRNAGDCPFCGTPVVTGTEQVRLFQPKSLLPFLITEKDARSAFDNWIGNLWFAPSALKDKAKRDEKLLGIYIPYWTFDSHTDTFYRGERGTVYYERQLVTVIVNGQPRQQMQTVPRIRWTPASGRVRLFFDDVLVGATRTLPRAILDRLEPWDLPNLVPYSESYLSGFQSEIYQIDLDEGFEEARSIMDSRIYNAVLSDIGGDQQRVANLQTQHSARTFKHLLLPVWSAAFRYNGETYRFVINGRNGKTQGERPYSIVKIVFAILLGLTVLGGLAYYMEKSGVFEQMMGQGVEYYQQQPGHHFPAPNRYDPYRYNPRNHYR
ncbi:primosomal protein N' (replication factor Y) - superfamily II helicase [Candidatus Thiothrix sp. Deng01]|uniref:Primosomal protein N' (Replication factor Y) -superfamily II helicase n=1 Tax=Candidatus Thiothrix phosphatis TaxID=3112415 RepID=A0ABU6CY26_9GAMM|nr:primosomal protein N' (replication factor Y) - superfamily II helicase [Candidatus Thiothrix sp. Deng01]MEB4591456.1 primosomal protein N' (replication factor Y) - superfamily II helicase [Candidatus Thiothrix sp. Deng01]